MAGFSLLDELTIINELKAIESLLGREDRERWHEREIDIDLLLFGSYIIKSASLTVPHPRMHERKFVLVPAAEIAGDFIHPVFGLSIKEMLEECKDNSIVKFNNAS